MFTFKNKCAKFGVKFEYGKHVFQRSKSHSHKSSTLYFSSIKRTSKLRFSCILKAIHHMAINLIQAFPLENILKPCQILPFTFSPHGGVRVALKCKTEKKSQFSRSIDFPARIRYSFTFSLKTLTLLNKLVILKQLSHR